MGSWGRGGGESGIRRIAIEKTFWWEFVKNWILGRCHIFFPILGDWGEKKGSFKPLEMAKLSTNFFGQEFIVSMHR